MKRILLLITVGLFLSYGANAQFESYRDSVVQIYGVVMSSDSLAALPGASIMVIGRNQGTIANDKGVFSIVVLKGDQLEFSSVGFKDIRFTVPRNLEGNQHSMIQLMVQDTVHLPATIIRKYPTREEFERAFVTTEVPDTKEEVARRNMSEANQRALMNAYPMSGAEGGQYIMQQNVRKYYSAGQLPPQNIFNPFAWAEFIKAWKRGDFKKK
ncbi:MAG: carboxypeptidase-like regulatory domain-containing protein [Chitinophagaceae bacterium]|nr:carboxypeptidase-like regulatory domain-containing protein [Chitinophagaceae bacterium]